MNTLPPSTETSLILVVDDDRDLRLMLRRILEQAGYGVIEAPDGEQAIQQYRAARPDVVILDVMMPYMNGFEVAQRMRALRQIPWTPILILTGLHGVAKTVEGLEAGADDFLGKPYSGAELMARVRALLRLKQLHKELEQRAAALEQERQELESKNITLHRVLRRYVSQEVADLVLANPTKNLALGGAACAVSVLVARLHHFIPFSSAHEPEAVFQTLNQLWAQVVPLIFQMHGTFDKYIGESLVAFYGAPIPLGDDALRAVHTAIGMQEQFAALQRQQQGTFAGMGLSIGIVTGEALVGNVGNEDILDYTVVGAVPAAADALQAQARSGQIVICEQTQRAVQGEVTTRRLKMLPMAGFAEPLTIHEVLGRQRAYQQGASLLDKLRGGPLRREEQG